MTKMKRDKTELRTVTYPLRLTQYEYNALQRYAIYNGVKPASAAVGALKLIPGMMTLQLEEKEAHANEINEEERREREANRVIEDDISHIA